jgi:hypothetical protein
VPIDPDAPGRLALTLFRLASGVEADILRRIAGTLAGGIDAPGWQVRKERQVSVLRASIEGAIGGFIVDGQRAAGETIDSAWTLGINAGLSDLEPVLLGALTAGNLPGARGLYALSAELSGAIASTRHGILRSAMDIFRTAVAQTAGQVLLGARTRRDVAQQVLNRLASSGVTGFTDTAGRRWQLASYTEMATRTVAQRAMTKAHTDTLQANGHDLIIVSNAPQECVRCRPWENQILSLIGEGRRRLTVASAVELNEAVTVDVAGSLDEAKRAGLYHPNCRHSHAAYLPGLTKPPAGPAADPEGNAARVKLRALERSVRAAKLREAAALDPAAARDARAQVRGYQQQIRDHVAATPGLLRQPARELIGKAR